MNTEERLLLLHSQNYSKTIDLVLTSDDTNNDKDSSETERKILHLVIKSNHEQNESNQLAVGNSRSSSSLTDDNDFCTISRPISSLTGLRDALIEELYISNYDSKEVKKISSEIPSPTINSNVQHNDDVPLSSRQTHNKATLDEMKRFELFRSVITHEDNLLNQRVSWVILAQSFLMAAYITATDAPDSLRFVTAAVGLSTVIVTLPAILAAGRNVEVQQQVYFRQIESDERCLLLHGHKRDLSLKMETNEEFERLKFGHVLPNMAYRSRVAVKILYTAWLLAGVQILGWILLLVAFVHDWI